MMVCELKELIKDLPDDTQMLCATRDYSYRKCKAIVSTVLTDESEWSEDLGEEVTPESEHGKRVLAVIFD